VATRPINIKLDSAYPSAPECEIQTPPPCSLVIFGGHGDLAARKMMPALYRLSVHRFLPHHFFVLATDAVPESRERYLETMREAVVLSAHKDFSEIAWQKFADCVDYLSFNYNDRTAFDTILKPKLAALAARFLTGPRHVFYLAVPPSVFETAVANLGEVHLSDIQEDSFPHLVIEKPFAWDLESSRRLDMRVSQYFREKQVFRIDHYVAKETVQDMLMFRFANSMFEPVWNRGYVDHVEITAAETTGIEHRTRYYEEAGVLRDMFQSHLFELMTMCAMEPPVAFEAERVRDERVKVFRSVRPLPLDRLGQYVALGQYGPGKTNGKRIPGYREEPGVPPRSVTPTFAAMKVFIDNWRWNGVPFYLRSGKRLAGRMTSVSIHFKPVPHLMFLGVAAGDIEPNTLVFRVQPDEGISLTFQTKMPGSRLCLQETPVQMNFSYGASGMLDAYEWVLLDCMTGDQMLFLRKEGVELTWAFLTPILERLAETSTSEMFPNYPACSEGPTAAFELTARDGRTWRPLGGRVGARFPEAASIERPVRAT
jgi:glucose-6-phosphate 1-dehydrogenase